jgi:hypothetical protein
VVCRLSVRAVGQIVDQVSAAARLDISAHVLRHTFCTRLVRAGHDLVLVAELAGHRNRAALPWPAQPFRSFAVAKLVVGLGDDGGDAAGAQCRSDRS